MPSHAVWHYYNYKVYTGSTMTINNIDYHESLWVTYRESNDRYKFYLRATDVSMVNQALGNSNHNGFNLTTREVNGVLIIESMQALTLDSY